MAAPHIPTTLSVPGVTCACVRVQTPSEDRFVIAWVDNTVLYSSVKNWVIKIM
jgi:hypothetical protein